jgi:predicted GNAT family N-acyltransferase
MRFCEIAHGSAEFEQAVRLRDEVLRKPLKLSFSPEELLAESDSYHLAVFQDDALIACAVLTPLEKGKVRMRQVAVAFALQHQGIGTMLVGHVEQFARAHGFGTIVVHAREPVVQFYERLGYTRIGEPFVEVTIPHFLLEKLLL